MKRILTAVAVMLLFPCLLFGQVTLSISEQPSKSDVANAKSTLVRSSPGPIRLKVGGYALASLDATSALKVHIIAGSDDCLKQGFLPKGTAWEGFGVPSESKKWEWVTIAADKEKDRYRIHATTPGTATIIWFATVNGEAKVVTEYKFIVEGEAEPDPDKPPPPPVISPLAKEFKRAYELDTVAGKGGEVLLGKMEGVFAAMGRESFSNVTTWKQYTAFVNDAVGKAGIDKDYTKALTMLRTSIQQYLLNRFALKDDPNYDDKPITDKAQLTQAMKDIAAALGEVSP